MTPNVCGQYFGSPDSIFDLRTVFGPLRTVFDPFRTVSPKYGNKSMAVEFFKRKFAMK